FTFFIININVVLADEHIWIPLSGTNTVASSSRSNECYVGEKECRKVGEKQNCVACRIVVHSACISILQQLQVSCKITYQEDKKIKKSVLSGIITGQSSELIGRHHWIHKWKQKGRCLHCDKSFQQKIFSDKV
ncbi:unnamed protein product, partial [Thelazia callipaeda]|uniref:Diacylglycerol kinase n=1 Tax=Thelazia callipaeda TaxID=103827 RepID=A0A0N5D5G0_THECL